MSLNPQTLQANAKKQIKFLFLPPPGMGSGEVEYIPRFYFEARIDFADVRSGLRTTANVNRALEIYPFDEEALWTRDMVWTVDSAGIRAEKPASARLGSLPAYINGEFLSRLETHCLRYLLRYYEAKLLRNCALGIYSSPGESESEFSLRCLEGLRDSFRRDLDGLRETSQRKLERIKEKYLNSDNWSGLEPSQARSRLRIVLHQMSESMTEFFLKTEYHSLPVLSVKEESGIEIPELGERIASLEAEVRRAVKRLKAEYQARADSHDEYLVRPGVRDIHLEQVCILWVPA